MQTIFNQLYEATLLCKPKNFSGFAIRYLSDCKAVYAEEAHALHFLPFLLYQPDQFQNYACTLYCAHISGRSAILAGGGEKPTSTMQREHLDSIALMDIIHSLDLPALGMQCNAIDEVGSSIID
jgi:hypothetical protein